MHNHRVYHVSLYSTATTITTTEKVITLKEVWTNCNWYGFNFESSSTKFIAFSTYFANYNSYAYFTGDNYIFLHYHTPNNEFKVSVKSGSVKLNSIDGYRFL